jgi:hypothetical protein
MARNHQDDVMSTKPEFTYFKFPERTSFNFGEDWIPLDINYRNTPNYYQAGQSYYVDIGANADLLEELMLNITIENLNSTFNTASFNYTGNDIKSAFNFIDQVEFLINDKVIIRYPIEYILSLVELTDSYGIKCTQAGATNTNAISDVSRFEVVNPTTIQAFLPLKFWFCDCPANALPLWAAQNVRFGIRFKLVSALNSVLGDLITGYTASDYNINIRLLARYAYLDIDEKRKFQSQSLEYIFEQVDYVRDNLPQSSQIITRKYDLPRANYVKEVLWTYQPIQNPPDHVNSAFVPLNTSSQLLFNGIPITTINDEKYYRLVQRYQSHNSGYAFKLSIPPPEKSNIYCYSFSLLPDALTSHGFLTTEKYNNIVAEIGHNITNPDLIYGVRFCILQRKMNILRVKDGKADTLYN